MSALTESQRQLLLQRLKGKATTSASPRDEIPRRDPSAAAGPLLASLGQQGVFAAHETDPESPSLNVTSSFEVVGALDLKILERAVATVIERHEVLRSHYRIAEEGVVQHVRDSLSLPVRVIHCAPEELQSRAEESVRVPFDLETGPLLRLTYIEPSEGRPWLVLTVHDIIFDKWSLGLFWNEVATLYRQERSGEPVGLAPVPLQYSDFAAWQRRELIPERYEKQLAYWRETLEEPPSPLDLPTDHAYPASLTDPGRLERGSLPADLTKRLKELAAAENVSLFTVLLLGYQALLHRYTDADDIVVASPIANRRSKDTAQLIGFFLSTVPMRFRLEGDPSVREAIQKHRDIVLGAIENQDPPFDRIVDAVRPPRVAGRHPLCQSMFVFQRQHEGAPEFDLGDVELRHIYNDTGTSKYDVTLFAAEMGEGMETVLEYRTDLFDPETMQRLLGHYEALLTSLVENPDRRFSELEILTEQERAQLLSGWQGARTQTESAFVVEQIERQIQASPEAPAVAGGTVTWSYRDLDRAADRVAAQLQDQGVRPGDRVGHFMDRTPSAIAGILGTLRAGAAYIPLDPVYPAERRALVLEDAGIAVAVVSPRLEKELGSTEVTAVVVDEDAPTQILKAPTAVAIEAQGPAYLIYTSGSTGRPKGVVVTHDNLRHSTAARGDFYGAPPKSFLLIPSLSFDSSVAGLFWALTSGACLVLADFDDQRDPERLAQLVDRHGVTDLLCIPALYREMLYARQAGVVELTTLRRAIVAGEACPNDLVALHLDASPDCELVNEYGPTEATVWATAHRCSEADLSRPVPIGRPIANTEVHMLDRHDRIVPQGVVGEIYVGGLGVAPGYWNREELTTEKFRKLPARTLGHGARMYATGDLGRWQADGTIDFLGRRDGQVKIRGYRVELGEVESAITNDAGISEAVVVTRQEATSGPWRLIAYLTERVAQPAEPSGSVDLDALRARLGKQLPAYAVPQTFLLVDELPRLPNGKVDRQNLPEPPARSSSQTENEQVTPRQETLLSIWEDVLGTSGISIHDDFFGLGGDSLMAIQIVSRARTAGVRIRPRDLTDHPTVAELATRVAATTEEDRPSTDEDLTGPIALTPIQSWFFRRNLHTPEQWNLATAFELRSDISTETVQRAVEAVVSRHPQLRAGFRSGDNGWIQEVNDRGRDLIDLSSQAASSAAGSEAYELAIQQVQASFAFDGSPLAGFATVATPLDPDTDRDREGLTLVIVAHHLVMDAVSWQILGDDFATALAATNADEPIGWGEPSAPFARWALWLDQLGTGKSSPEVDYWAARGDQPLSRLPMDRVSKDPLIEADAETLTVELAPELSTPLFREALDAYSNRVDDLLVAALVRSMANWSGVSEGDLARFRIGLERHGRDVFEESLDLSRTVGWLTSAFPIRPECRQGESVEASIKSTKETLRAVPHSGAGYGRLRYSGEPGLESRVGADENGEDVLFNYLGTAAKSATGESESGDKSSPVVAQTPLFRSTRNPSNSRSHPLEINCHRETEARTAEARTVDGATAPSDRLVMRWTYNTRAHERSTIERWAADYLQQLGEIVRHCTVSDGGFTPSDFPDAGMDQDELDSFLDSL